MCLLLRFHVCFRFHYISVLATRKPRRKCHDDGMGFLIFGMLAAKGALTKLQEATTSELWNTRELLCCSSSLPSARDFFKDSPWLDIPKERRGEILIEPLYPRGGLLGGSSSQGTGKISKLAALAAARKKKDQGRSQDGSSGASNTSVALLDRLNGNARSTGETLSRPSSEMQTSEDRKQEPFPAHSDSLYPARIRKCSVPKEEEKVAEVLEPPGTEFQELKQLVVVPVAAPSMFAKVMFGMADAVYERQSKRMKTMVFALPQGPDAEINPFAGPSPDDEVSRAQQHSKGLISRISDYDLDKLNVKSRSQTKRRDTTETEWRCFYQSCHQKH